MVSSTIPFHSQGNHVLRKQGGCSKSRRCLSKTWMQSLCLRKPSLGCYPALVHKETSFESFCFLQCVLKMYIHHSSPLTPTSTRITDVYCHTGLVFPSYAMCSHIIKIYEMWIINWYEEVFWGVCRGGVPTANSDYTFWMQQGYGGWQNCWPLGRELTPYGCFLRMSIRLQNDYRAFLIIGEDYDFISHLWEWLLSGTARQRIGKD